MCWFGFVRYVFLAQLYNTGCVQKRVCKIRWCMAASVNGLDATKLVSGGSAWKPEKTGFLCCGLRPKLVSWVAGSWLRQVRKMRSNAFNYAQYFWFPCAYFWFPDAILRWWFLVFLLAAAFFSWYRRFFWFSETNSCSKHTPPPWCPKPIVSWSGYVRETADMKGFDIYMYSGYIDLHATASLGTWLSCKDLLSSAARYAHNYIGGLSGYQCRSTESTFGEHLSAQAEWPVIWHPADRAPHSSHQPPPKDPGQLT